jgi:hypothetical protein
MVAGCGITSAGVRIVFSASLFPGPFRLQLPLSELPALVDGQLRRHHLEERVGSVAHADLGIE